LLTRPRIRIQTTRYSFFHKTSVPVRRRRRADHRCQSRDRWRLDVRIGCTSSRRPPNNRRRARNTECKICLLTESMVTLRNPAASRSSPLASAVALCSKVRKMAHRLILPEMGTWRTPCAGASTRSARMCCRPVPGCRSRANSTLRPTSVICPAAGSKRHASKSPLAVEGQRRFHMQLLETSRFQEA
jgi:hypothetical protein